LTFVSHPGETGTANVVVCRADDEKHRRELLGSTLLTVDGHAERIEDSSVPVEHPIAPRLSDQSQPPGNLVIESRDFCQRHDVGSSSRNGHRSAFARHVARTASLPEGGHERFVRPALPPDAGGSENPMGLP
jgi:hypothetical protein